MSIGYRLCSLSYKRWSFSQPLPEAAPGGSRPPGSEHSAAGAMPCSRRGTRRGTFWQWNWRWRCLSWAQIDGFTDYFRTLGWPPWLKEKNRTWTITTRFWRFEDGGHMTNDQKKRSFQHLEIEDTLHKHLLSGSIWFVYVSCLRSSCSVAPVSGCWACGTTCAKKCM